MSALVTSSVMTVSKPNTGIFQLKIMITAKFKMRHSNNSTNGDACVV